MELLPWKRLMFWKGPLLWKKLTSRKENRLQWRSNSRKDQRSDKDLRLKREILPWKGYPSRTGPSQRKELTSLKEANVQEGGTACLGRNHCPERSSCSRRCSNPGNTNDIIQKDALALELFFSKNVRNGNVISSNILVSLTRTPLHANLLQTFFR